MDRHLSRRPGRGGFQILMLVLLVGLLILCSALAVAKTSRQPLLWAARFAGELALRDVALSALEEATHEVLAAVNASGADLAAALRRPGWTSVDVEPKVTRSRALAARLAGAGPLTARARFSGRRALVPGAEEDTEWAARLTVTVELANAGPAGGRLVGTQEREVRSTSICPPRPLDAFGLAVAGRPGRTWQPPMETGSRTVDLRMDPEIWRAKATLVCAGADPVGDHAQLTRRLGTVNGVVVVENEGGRPLVLRGIKHRGKTVLVAMGPLTLSDVTPEDPAVDLLTVVAFGDVEVAGTVQAALVLTGRQGEPVPARRVAAGFRLRGALVVTCGDLPAAPGARFSYDTAPSFAGPQDAPIRPDRLVISVSPRLTDSRLEARS